MLASLARDATLPRMRPMQIAPRVWPSVSAAVLIMLTAALPAAGQGSVASQETKPYDERLLRLSEILGAVHYLRELCGANDGQLWRDRMRELMDAEGSSALRRAKLTRSFNNGYRSYSRTYNNCTPSAQTAINRFLSEGAELADGMMKSVP
jgi:uncharacterized protein (TIGR02301 family)